MLEISVDLQAQLSDRPYKSCGNKPPTAPKPARLECGEGVPSNFDYGRRSARPTTTISFSETNERCDAINVAKRATQNHENRTSLPGSISKSSVSESSVFGLTTSSTNFT